MTLLKLTSQTTMSIYRKIITSLGITGSHGIVRRYMVVNSFDGALTMLGLIVGFYYSDTVELDVVTAACLGAAIALAVSGISSAYISESAEKKKELQALEHSMGVDMKITMHGRASRLLPVIVALVNGLSPLLVSLLILAPIFIASQGVAMPLPPLELAMLISLVILFLFGVYLGHIGSVNLVWAGLRTLLIALATITIIFLVGRVLS